MSDNRRSSLETIIQTAIETALKEVHTALPAVVEAFYPDTQLIDAQITIKRKINDSEVNLPKLTGVPVRYLCSDSFSITFPLAAGDHVLLIFSERSIDLWLQEGGLQSPKDVRRHSLSDAFAIPIMYSQKELISSFDPDNLQIRTKDGANFITLTATGDIYLNGNTDSAISFTDMKTAFDQLKNELNNFISVYNSHNHGGSGPSAPGIPATADMSAAELTTIKVP